MAFSVQKPPSNTHYSSATSGGRGARTDRFAVSTPLPFSITVSISLHFDFTFDFIDAINGAKSFTVNAQNDAQAKVIIQNMFLVTREKTKKVSKLHLIKATKFVITKISSSLLRMKMKLIAMKYMRVSRRKIAALLRKIKTCTP